VDADRHQRGRRRIAEVELQRRLAADFAERAVQLRAAATPSIEAPRRRDAEPGPRPP
jgi:hypothetical protein